jgi:hypothetical protein
MFLPAYVQARCPRIFNICPDMQHVVTRCCVQKPTSCGANILSSDGAIVFDTGALQRQYQLIVMWGQSQTHPHLMRKRSTLCRMVRPAVPCSLLRYCQSMHTTFRSSRSTRWLPVKRMIITKPSHQYMHVHFYLCIGIMIDVCLISFSDYSLLLFP